MEQAVSSDRSFFGHPRGLGTLFFTEMWERFSYYGMRAILVLFMTEAILNGGMGMDEPKANAIYGIYTACVYLFSLPGGWLADHLFGQRKAIWYGGIIIASGHFSMAIPTQTTFFLGLVLIVLGTGLLKPNISAIVGGLYPEGGARRDAGFSVFYMGINLGAFISPLICGYLGEQINWHMGFGAAGVGMVLGLIQFKLTDRHLGDLGLEPEVDHQDPVAARKHRMVKNTFIGGTVLLIIALALLFAGVIQLEVFAISNITGWVILGLAVGFVLYVFLFGDLDSTEKKRVGAICILFIFSSMFWMGFEQTGTSLNIFAKNLTDRMMFGWEMPASWLQSVNPVLIIVLAPVIGALWIKLAVRNLEPSTPIKFAFGMIFLGLGFLVMIGAANIAASGEKPLPYWLVLTYLLHTTGELALSPVGLSVVTKLAPHRYLGQLMGVWFMSISLGNLLAGRLAGMFESDNVQEMPSLFNFVGWYCVGAGVLLVILYKPIKKLMAGIR